MGGTYVNAGSDYTFTIGTQCITTCDGYIYVVVPGNGIIYKLDSDLNIISSITGPDYARGIFVDLHGQLVIINQDWAVGQNDIFWFYDTNLNYLGRTTDDFFDLMLRNWDAIVGGAYQKGNVAFFPGINIKPSATEYETSFYIPPSGYKKGSRLTSFEFSTEQAYVLEFGNQYLRFYK